MEKHLDCTVMRPARRAAAITACNNSLNGGQSPPPPVSLRGFALHIPAAQFTRFIRKPL
jgi:hypothetical protein